MLWVADAGATKTDWMGATSSIGLRTEGLNVEVEGWKAARRKLHAAAEYLRQHDAEVSTLHYYGPALHHEANRQQIQRLLAEAFQLSPQRVYVYHDLLGAARAAWGRQPGIVAILGTGSNCALWDGESIRQQAGGHGYLLGDEGSGADLGRAFLSALLHREVPSDIEQAFWQKNPYPEASSLLELRRMAYESPRPSAYLAGFVPVLSMNKTHPWVAALVRSRFTAFIQRTWARWHLFYPVRYVGGVAQSFSEILEELTLAYGGKWGGIVPSVIHALRDYHVQQ
ncbi:MAG: hypothetical protein N2253_01590 [Bacteroidia bacterium]|nr:hypothetical protein [Bacteroidia bacterium]MCX7763569.1 hypothetical protein [Bacteroidia bacterium]MDW8058248.1 hypothetical protein [Bacteroidia bacterium]